MLFVSLQRAFRLSPFLMHGEIRYMFSDCEDDTAYTILYV
jgi:hypothetical protein